MGFQSVRGGGIREEVGISNPSFDLRAGSNDPDAQKIAQIVKGDLAKIGVTANISFEPAHPTTLVNDAIIGNFQANVYACSIGVPKRQDFEDCSVYRPNKGPFSGDKTFPKYKQAYYDAAATVDPEASIDSFRARVRDPARDRLGDPDMHAWLLCGQRKEISGVVYDAKTYLIYQGIVKS